jgi:hypothetical protein
LGICPHDCVRPGSKSGSEESRNRSGFCPENLIGAPSAFAGEAILAPETILTHLVDRNADAFVRDTLTGQRTAVNLGIDVNREYEFSVATAISTTGGTS